MSIVSEYEAAALTAMSPELLRWFTGNAPKHGIDRKLKIASKDGATHFFKRDEVLAFDSWLRQPWPRKGGIRPHIPAGIRREIKEEASGACAICHGHQNTCEAAHIDPVSVTDNNHPENLIWLCANHHTAYDKGFFKPVAEEQEFVAGFKTTLRRYRIMLWRMQHEVAHKLFIVLDSCDQLAKQLAAAENPEQVKAVKHIAKMTLKELPALAFFSKTDPNFASFTSIVANVEALATGPVAKRLKRAGRVRAEYIAAFGFVPCPLCEGSGQFDGADCPVCYGDREVEEQKASGIDLSLYEVVNCPVCDGKGIFAGDTCPACGGNARMYRSFADQIDVRDYEKVPCPLCEGESSHRAEECPACGGHGNVDQRHQENIDLKDYEDVNCPLCEGEGKYEESECPECGGQGSMERRFAENVDISDYKKVKCPLCDGTGELRNNECPGCGGEGKVARHLRDRIDVSAFELVKCPICKGRQSLREDECRACGGNGEMERQIAENIDPGDYR